MDVVGLMLASTTGLPGQWGKVFLAVLLLNHVSSVARLVFNKACETEDIVLLSFATFLYGCLLTKFLYMQAQLAQTAEAKV